MANIEHVVVLMMENRSFDHIFGFRRGVNGLQGNEYNLLDPDSPESGSNPAFRVNANAPYAVLMGKGPGHSVHATNYQLCNSVAGPSPLSAASNDGFVRSYRDELRADHIGQPTDATMQVVMQSFSPDKLPALNALADNFCLCDNWYAEVPGPTQPNRFYIHAATSDGFALNNWRRELSIRTIYNLLNEAGKSWSTYSFDQNEVTEFSQVASQAANFKLFNERFAADVTANVLPNYSFVIPRFFNSKHATSNTAGLANSQHAPEDVRFGDNLIADVYEALRSNDELWKKCLLIVTYDEHGGFYDHIVPPSATNPDGHNSPTEGDPSYAPIFNFDRLGLRVPALLISPWIPKGIVDSTQYQHTSVLATLQRLFGLTGPLTERDRSAKAFDASLSLKVPRSDAPVQLPRAAMPPIPATDDPSHPANLPLDDDQREMLMRVYHLTQSSQPANVTAATLPITQGEAHDFIKESYRRHFERVPALA